MIYLIHGDNHLKSRSFLQEKLEKYKNEAREIIRFVDLFNPGELKQALESGSLFGQEKAIILENLFSHNGLENKKAINYLLGETKILPELVIWESKAINARILKKLTSDWQVMLFKTPRLVFKFLDSLKIASAKQSLILLRSVLRTEDPEFIFYMLIRQIRLLILAKERLLEKMAPWQKTKLARQAGYFTPEALLKLHQKLLEIDTKIKTGKTLMLLEAHLDLLVTSL